MALFLRVVNKLTDTFSTTIYFRMVVFLHNDNSFCLLYEILTPVRSFLFRNFLLTPTFTLSQ